MKRILLILSLAFALPVFATQAIAAEPVTEEAAAAQLVGEDGQPLQGQALVDAVMALIATLDSTDAQSIKAILTAAFKIADDATAALITQAALEYGVPPGLIVAASKDGGKTIRRTAKKESSPGRATTSSAPPANYSNANSYGTGGG